MSRRHHREGCKGRDAKGGGRWEIGGGEVVKEVVAGGKGRGVWLGSSGEEKNVSRREKIK